MEPQIPPDRLEIHQAKNEEVYRDIVRIPEDHRKNRAGKTIEEGRICKIGAGGKAAYVIVRGVRNFELGDSPPHSHGRCIHMDEVTRTRLGVEYGSTAHFELKPVGYLGQLKWACGATEIGYRLASRLGVLGAALGFISLLIALPEFFKWIGELIGWAQRLCAR